MNNERRPISTWRLGRFMERVEVDPETQCWVWQGMLDKTGRGRVNVHHKTHYAYQVAYEHFIGAIPNGYDLHHLCHNPACVNPTHLEPMRRGEHLALHRR